jgi:hypothetical protein
MKIMRAHPLDRGLTEEFRFTIFRSAPGSPGKALGFSGC